MIPWGVLTPRLPEPVSTGHDGHVMTGRDPRLLTGLINKFGDNVWKGIDADSDNDRGDPHVRLGSKHDRSRHNRRD